MFDFSCFDTPETPDYGKQISSDLGSVYQTCGKVESIVKERIESTLSTCTSVINTVSDKVTENLAAGLMAAMKSLDSTKGKVLTEYLPGLAETISSVSSVSNFYDQKYPSVCAQTVPGYDIHIETGPTGYPVTIAQKPKPSEPDKSSGEYNIYCPFDGGPAYAWPASIEAPNGLDRKVASSKDANDAVRQANNYRCEPSTPEPRSDYTVRDSHTAFACGIDAYRNNQVGNQLVRDTAAGLLGLQKAKDAVNNGPLKELLTFTLNMIQQPFLPTLCNSRILDELLKLRHTVEAIEKEAGFVDPTLKIALRYAINKECPIVTLTPDQALSAYLGNTLSIQALKDITEANGNCWDPFRAYAESRTPRYSENQLFALRARNKLTYGEYSERMRALGWLDEPVKENLYDLSQFIPGPADLIRFMVRDAADDTLAARFELDTDFNAKWDGLVKKYGDWQRIEPEVAKLYWRSHWSIPSPTQLYEMFHRLRNGDENGENVVDEDTLTTALQQQDIAPYWIKRLIAVSFHPLTRIDIRRAYDIGTIDKKDVTKRLKQVGYNDDDANKLSDLFDDEKKDAISDRKPIKQWKQELISRQDASAKLKKYGYEQADIDEALDKIEPSFVDSKAAKQFKAGVISKKQFDNRLTKAGLGFAAIDSIAKQLSPPLGQSIALVRFRSYQTSEQDFVAELRDEGFSDDESIDVASREHKRLSARLQAACVKGIRRQFMTAAVNRAQAAQMLTGRGLAFQWSNEIIDGWECEKDALGKEFTLSQLSKLYERGVINDFSLRDRIGRVGYDEDDSALLAYDIAVGVNERRAREMAKVAKERGVAIEKAQRESEKLAKATEKRQSEMQKRSELARKANAKREAIVLDIAGDYAAIHEMDTLRAIEIVKGMYAILRQGPTASPDERLQALAKAVAGSTGEPYDKTTSNAMAYLASFIGAAATLE